MAEFWRPVVGFEGFYEVSDQGRVRSVDRTVIGSTGRECFYKGQILKQRPGNEHGHLYVNFKRAGKNYCSTVHKLVLTAFVGPRPEGLECCHGTKGKTCNELTNLCWGTPLKNSGEDKRRDDSILYGERHQNHKLTTEQVEAIRSDMRPQDAIATDYKISTSYVSSLKLYRSRKHG